MRTKKSHLQRIEPDTADKTFLFSTKLVSAQLYLDFRFWAVVGKDFAACWSMMVQLTFLCQLFLPWANDLC